MKKFIAMVLALMMALALVSCGGSSKTEEPAPAEEPAASDNAPAEEPAAEPAEEPAAEPAEGPAAELSGTVSTNGSTSMEKVMAALIEAFNEKYPDVTITYDGTGSGAGITAATEGSADIGLSSRNLKEEETGLTANIVALDGIAIVVNTSNTVEDLSLEQIAGLFNGTITNWSEVGGPDQEVAVIGREAGSGTRDGFESIVDVKDACVYDQELTSTGAVIAAVASNENAIGYASLSAVDDTVKMITVGGITATEETVKDGTYAIQRPFVMVTNESTPLSDAAQAFLDFAMSPEAADIIAAAGAIQP